jgi:hypothetical protein
MERLNLPDHGVKLRQDADGARLWDPLRRKWLLCTPEEWVRQHVVNHLVHDRGCPASLIALEHGIRLNGLAKRADVVVHDRRGAPLLLVECKAPGVPVDQGVFEQAARYNKVFRVPYLLVTNGLKHYCCRLDLDTGAVEFLSAVPDFAAMAGV